MFFPQPKHNLTIKKIQVKVDPSWYLVWGNQARLTSNFTWQEGELSIAHSQPVFSPDKNLVLVGDIWLSNQASLQSSLSGYSQNNINNNINNQVNNSIYDDLEIVAQLWESYGLECLKLLEGIWNLAVFDRKKQELYVVRDRTGGKSLFYIKNQGVIYIAPRLVNLAPFHAHQLDLIALRDYLICAFVPGEQTLWQGIRELKPGHYLHLPSGNLQVYWQPQENIQNADQSLEWHGEKLRFLLEEVVQEYLPANQPVGVFLSGGIDSSCITAIAKKLHDQPVHTYSIYFGEKYPHELEFANLVAQHCQTEHHILTIEPQKLWELLPLTLAHMDQPIGEGLTVPNLLIGEQAKQDVDVVLNGEGGDPCFGGPKNSPMLLNSLYQSVSDIPMVDIESAYLTSFKKCYPYLSQLLKPAVWQAVKLVPSLFADDLQRADTSYLNRLMLINIKIKGADYILSKVNCFSQANNLAGRSPLFDRRIVELSLQIPPAYKLSLAEEKAVLKMAVKDLLPEAIIQRPKSGMVMNLYQWFQKFWYRSARQLLLSKNAEISPYLNQDLIRQWLNYQGEISGRYGTLLWLLVTLEIWLQVQKNYRKYHQ